MFRFACKMMGADRDRLAFWLAAGCSLVLSEGVYRLEADASSPDPRRPSPAPVPEALALAAIQAGAPMRRDGDLFGAVEPRRRAA
ncbi:UNVERIFIED_CONTAM: hypothetical protein Q9R58_17785 [Methylobacteriaceae bacterium AG10]|nr:hypothetical protein [Methylobacteriaceae bacterium AG10]